MSTELTSWLIDSSLLFIQICLILVWCYGVLLLVLPNIGITLQQTLNRRFSGRQFSRSLEVPQYLEPLFYRHARPLGLGLMLGALLLLYLNWQLPAQVSDNSPALWAWLAESLYWFLWLAGIAILFIGLACVVRPSLLKPLEARANRWVSTRQKTRLLSEEHTPLDDLLRQYPRLFGIVIAAAASLLLLVLIKA